MSSALLLLFIFACVHLLARCNLSAARRLRVPMSSAKCLTMPLKKFIARFCLNFWLFVFAFVAQRACPIFGGFLVGPTPSRCVHCEIIWFVPCFTRLVCPLHGLARTFKFNLNVCKCYLLCQFNAFLECFPFTFAHHLFLLIHLCADKFNYTIIYRDIFCFYI